ncbi:hypothetical protein C8R45DRAFT_1093026 [Mycena sanguinolenta]|nr:hypothetical protein C8R45DRAFT_1093026 [Mycena sanguinolenta]
MAKKAPKKKQLAAAREKKKKEDTPSEPPKKKKKSEHPVPTLKLCIPAPKIPRPEDPTPGLLSPVPDVSPAITPPPKLSQKAIKAASTDGRSLFVEGIAGEDSDQESMTTEEQKSLHAASNDSESESESDADNADNNEIRPFQLKFSVLFDGANSMLKVLSLVQYQDLLSKLADIMSLPHKSVRVAYHFSTQPATTPLTYLSGPKHLSELVAVAHKTMNSTTSKKEFFVVLKDLAEAAAKGNGKVDPKADKKSKNKGKRKLSDSDSDGDSSDTVDAEKIKKKKKSLPQLVTQLEADNACTEHGGHGCLKRTTGHVQLSKQDLSTWAVFMQTGYTSTMTPPPKFIIGSGQPAPSKTAQPPPVAPPVPLQPLAFPMAGMPRFGYPFTPTFAPTMPWQPWLTPEQPFQTPQASKTANCHQDVLSSLPEEVEDNRLFPRLGKWLEGLDGGNCGADGHNFSQYAEDFEHEKYIHIVDLEMLQVTDLTCLIPEIPKGTATKILAYANADITRIQKEEKRRVHVEARKGSRYT